MVTQTFQVSDAAVRIGDTVVVDRPDLQQLFDALTKRGYTVVGPTVRDGAIIYDELGSVDDLPAGWTDEQEAGTYRIKRREDEALFGYVVGPYSWKRFLYPPVLSLWKAKRDGKSFEVIEEKEEVPAYAFIGVRACELAAMRIQDRVFQEGTYVDPVYKARREKAFIVAVNCGEAHSTCFCASMGTGPGVTADFDISMTEILEAGEHYFVIEAGSHKGAEVLREVRRREARLDDRMTAEHVVKETTAQMGRHMEVTGAKEILYANYENSRWDEVATRCLNCANCTMVCPTCFCMTVEDTTDLTGETAERVRKWDSCFTMDFSYIHGGSIRASGKSRYRQWMTHKLASWVDQFGTMGCVGCGRCITWCPVGIDITEEMRAIRENPVEAPAK